MAINTKSKNFKIIIFSIIGLAVLAGVVLILSLTAPKEEGEGETTSEAVTDDPALVLQPEDMGEVERIEVQNELGSYSVKRTVEKNGDVRWDLEGHEDIDRTLLSDSSFENLASSLKGMKARSLIEENAADLAQYGLDKPIAKAEVTFENGNYTLLIGTTVTSGSANYVMVEGNPNVYSYYSYSLSHVLEDDAMSFVGTSVMPSFDQNNSPKLKKITVTRKDWEEPLVLEALPELPEDSTSIQVFSYTFTSPYSVYLDLTNGSNYLNAMNGLTADKAAYIDPTEEETAKTGLDDPYCQIDQLAGDTIYRLYIGNAITEEVTDEVSGATETVITGYYGRSNMVPNVIYIFSPDKLIWTSMEQTQYMSELFLMPYIYDLDTVRYTDGSCDFTVKVEGNNDENHFYMEDKEVDGDKFRQLYQFFVSCHGEEFYTDDEKGELIASITYSYDDTREPSTVSLYESGDRRVIININGENVFKTKWNYGTRLKENAQAFLNGGEIVSNY